MINDEMLYNTHTNEILLKQPLVEETSTVAPYPQVERNGTTAGARRNKGTLRTASHPLPLLPLPFPLLPLPPPPIWEE